MKNFFDWLIAVGTGNDTSNVRYQPLSQYCMYIFRYVKGDNKMIYKYNF